MADDVHRAVLMECLDELCRGSSSIVSHMTLLGGHMTSCDHTQVPGAGVPSEEVDGRGFKNIIPRSPSTLSIQSLFGSLGKGRTSPSHPHTLTPSHPHTLTPGGDMQAAGHSFRAHSFAAPHWCDVCGRFLWGLVRQGMRCKGTCTGTKEPEKNTVYCT